MTEILTFYTVPLPRTNRERSVGYDAADARIVIAERRGDEAARVLTHFTFDQGVGLAQLVIAGDERAIARPKALMELAGFALGMLAALERPDLFPQPET